MNRAAYNWIRLVLPRWWPLFMVAELMFETPYLIVAHIGFVAGINSQAIAPHDLLLVFTAALYGAFRAFAFHPLWQPEYRRWLELTPWNHEKRLPKGPVHLVWQDAVVLGILVALQHDSNVARHALPFAFAMAYLLVLAASIGPFFPNAAYGLLLGMSVPVLLSRNYPLSTLAACLLLYGFAVVFTRKVLSLFPWRLSDHWERSLKRFATIGENPDVRLGWPADSFQANPAPWRIAVYDGTVLSLLAGWWIWVLFEISRDPELGVMAETVVVGFCVVLRFGLYFLYLRPPISILGRVATGRLLIPRYDVALAAPFVAMLIPLVLPVVANRYGISSKAACGIATTAALLVAFNMGPTLEAWRLTGAHRIVPIRDKARFIKH